MNWLPVHDGDDRARALYLRHYSSKKNRATAGPVSTAGRQFGGKGERSIYLTLDCSAVWCWRKVPDGILCSLFRNEGAVLSSELVKEADSLADIRWPLVKRHYTYVNAAEIRSSNPGYCFLMAGWRKCGYSKAGLLILERGEGDAVSGLRDAVRGTEPRVWSLLGAPAAFRVS